MPEANTNATAAAPATPAAGNAAPDVVSKAAHDELAGRYGSTLQQMNELKSRLAEFETKAESAKKAELEKNGEFQKLAETERSAREQAEKERDALKAQYEVDTKKYQLGLAAKSAGINDVNDAIQLIDISAIEIKDGKVDGIDKAVSKLKEEKPYLFTGARAPLPHGARPDGTQLTKADLTKDYVLAEKLYTENPAEYQRIMHGK